MRPAVGLLFLIACDPATEGTLSVRAWGEEGAFEGFPNDEVTFIDGWSVQYDNVLVGLSNFELADPVTEEVVASDDAVYVVDLAAATTPVDVTSFNAPIGRQRYSYSRVEATEDATNVNADPAVFDAMVAGGHDLWLSGTATNGERSVTFAWGINRPVTFTFCESGADGNDGVAIVEDGTSTAESTLHLDHLYWDRLGVEEANLRFDPIAAWADESGAVPFADLAGSPTAALVDRDGEPVNDDGGAQLTYDDAGIGLTDLRAFILFASTEMGHMDGVGECTPVDP